MLASIDGNRRPTCGQLAVDEQREVGDNRRPAVVVHDDLRDGEGRALVVVGDLALFCVTACHGDVGAVAIGRRIAGSRGLGDGIGPRRNCDQVAAVRFEALRDRSGLNCEAECFARQGAAVVVRDDLRDAQSAIANDQHAVGRIRVRFLRWEGTHVDELCGGGRNLRQEDRARGNGVRGVLVTVGKWVRVGLVDLAGRQSRAGNLGRSGAAVDLCVLRALVQADVRQLSGGTADRHADGRIDLQIVIGVEERTCVTSVCTAPADLIPIPGHVDGRRQCRVIDGQLGEVLLARLVVRAVLVNHCDGRGQDIGGVGVQDRRKWADQQVHQQCDENRHYGDSRGS